MKVVQYNKANAPITVDAAKAGPALDVSGFGPLTVAVQLALSGASSPTGITATLQGSMDGVTWFNVDSTVNLTANGAVFVGLSSVNLKQYRINYARSSGSIVVTETFLVYGDRI